MPLVRLFIARGGCALLAFVSALVVVALDNKFSIRKLAGAYLGLEVLFSLIGVVINWRLGFRFLASYIFLTIFWLVLAILVVVRIG